jgi:PAS domain S-box-containing protein
MNTPTLREQLAEAQATIRALQEELAESNRGIVALNMELEQRVEERTAELARSNEALRASAADWERTFDSVPDLVAILDAQYRIVRANRAMAERLGVTAQQCVGLRCYEVVHGATEPPDFCPHAQTCRDHRQHTAEVREPRLGGDFLVSTTPRFDEQGGLMGAVHVARDITERKRAEDRTRLFSEVTSELLSSGQPQQIVESLCRKVMAQLDCQTFFNFLMDEQSGRLHLNACAGISADKAREIEWLDLGAAVCGCAARDGCRIVAEHIQTTPDPRTDLVRGFGIQAYACHPLLNQNQVIGTLSFGSRTRPAFAEDELRLMKAVADHVAIAMQRIRLLESLERAARAADAANEAKGRFLANISHELRTPMNAILGMIDVAMSKAAQPIVKDCLQTVKGAADLLLTLLNDLLDSSKIEAGKLELESAPFSLRRMLDQITPVLAVRASEKGLHFHCRMPDEMPDALMGDRTRLQQVLINLAGNAIKFTPRGEVEVSVRARTLPSPGNDRKLVGRGAGGDGQAALAPSPARPHPNPLPEGEGTVFQREGEGSVELEFAVRDTGIGIPAADMERIFHPFAQADVSTTRRFGGTGLGLSICSSLVGMMGGRIRVESEVGTGSTFCFTVRLPLATETPLEPETPLDVPAAARSKLRILLVEDNPANQKLATYILEERGHTVEIAGDGQEAIRLTHRNCYDAILMDVQMPGMDGLAATMAIREREGSGIGESGKGDGPHWRATPSGPSRPTGTVPVSARVPIIAMTAHALKGDRDRCLAAGMDAYLSKPIDAHELIGLVENLSAGSASAAEAKKGEAEKGTGPICAEHPEGRSGKLDLSPVPARTFDPELALKRCLNKRDVLEQMIAFFFKDADDFLPQLRAALQKGDLAEVGRLGHRLKGTVSHVGAEAAREAALGVEHFLLHPGDPALAAETVEALERECEVLRAALAEYQAATGHGGTSASD